MKEKNTKLLELIFPIFCLDYVKQTRCQNTPAWTTYNLIRKPTKSLSLQFGVVWHEVDLQLSLEGAWRMEQPKTELEREGQRKKNVMPREGDPWGQN